MNGSLGTLLDDLFGGGMPASGGQGSPTMNGYGFNWYGGRPRTPQGGYYNQMSQAMAGPSYSPAGSNFYSGGAGTAQAPSVAGKGALPWMGAPQQPGIQ